MASGESLGEIREFEKFRSLRDFAANILGPTSLLQSTKQPTYTSDS
jgi:hypothetical protein